MFLTFTQQDDINSFSDFYNVGLFGLYYFATTVSVWLCFVCVSVCIFAHETFFHFPRLAFALFSASWVSFSSHLFGFARFSLAPQLPFLPRLVHPFHPTHFPFFFCGVLSKFENILFLNRGRVSM